MGWEYDSAGNQTRALSPAGGWLRYEYDAANRLVSVKDDNGNTLASYTYGATNERLISEESGARTYYASEGGQVFAEYVEYGAQTTPQWTKSYVYLGGRLLSTFTPTANGESIQHHHPDRLGTRLVTDPANGTSFEQASLPFGNSLAVESTGATNRRFTSYDRSTTTGLDYAVNRRYDPMQGRFTQVDPIEMDAVSLEHPQTLNLYAYCGNDPVNHIDPDGLFFGFLKKLFRAIFKVVLWAAVAVTTAVAVLLPHPGTFAVAGLMWAYALGGPRVQRALGFAGAVASAYNSILAAVGGTPPWNPNVNSFQDCPDCPNVINETVTVNASVGVAPLILRGILIAAGAVAKFVAKNWRTIWGGIKSGVSWAWGGIKRGVRATGRGIRSGWRWTKRKWYNGTNRPLKQEDLGIEGRIDELRGNVSLNGDVLTVRVDMIRGEINNPFQILGNLTDVARGYGARTLRIEGTIANSGLYRVLQRYGLRTSGATDSITVPVP